jgi:hypothetical protein
MDKLPELRKYSNPSLVKNRAERLNLNQVFISTRKDKKYMIYNGRQWIHFGQMGYEDYTKHHDDVRRDNFRKRNRRWFFGPIYSPGRLSYTLLW